jgi:hypothetical protein
MKETMKKFLIFGAMVGILYPVGAFLDHGGTISVPASSSPIRVSKRPNFDGYDALGILSTTKPARVYDDTW